MTNNNRQPAEPSHSSQPDSGREGAGITRPSIWRRILHAWLGFSISSVLVVIVILAGVFIELGTLFSATRLDELYADQQLALAIGCGCVMVIVVGTGIFAFKGRKAVAIGMSLSLLLCIPSLLHMIHVVAQQAGESAFSAEAWEEEGSHPVGMALHLAHSDTLVGMHISDACAFLGAGSLTSEGPPPLPRKSWSLEGGKYLHVEFEGCHQPWDSLGGCIITKALVTDGTWWL